MEAVTAFNEFLSNIELPPDERQSLKDGYQEVKEKLLSDRKLKKAIHTIFLQGSYRRRTAIAPHRGKKADVDLVVVTKLDKREWSPEAALGEFQSFVEEHYSGRYEYQGRSIAIELDTAKLDLVPTSQPGNTELGILRQAAITANEFEDVISAGVLRKMWAELDDGFGEPSPNFDRMAPLEIPDREAKVWEPTHPLAQIRWTQAKNQRCNESFVPVVKTVKWWLRHNYEIPKYPKGYTVEHIVGDCCPDGLRSVPEGVARTFEAISARFQQDVASDKTPALRDRGVNQNVLKRLSPRDFAVFHERAKTAAGIARRALNAAKAEETADLWRSLFGDKYPKPAGSSPGLGGPRSPPGGGFRTPTAPAQPPDRRFA